MENKELFPFKVKVVKHNSFLSSQTLSEGNVARWRFDKGGQSVRAKKLNIFKQETSKNTIIVDF